MDRIVQDPLYEIQNYLQDSCPLMEERNVITEQYIKSYSLGKNLIDIYDNWVNNIIPNTVRSITRRIAGDDNKYLRFTDVDLAKPTYSDGGSQLLTLYPANARKRKLEYNGILTVKAEVYDTVTGEVSNSKVYKLAKLPIMVKSSKCNLLKADRRQLKLLGEDPDEPGGYFINKNGDRVVLIQEQLQFDKIILMKDKDDIYVARVTNEMDHSTVLTQVSYNVNPGKTNKIFKANLASMRITDEKESKKKTYKGFNVLILFRLLGVSNPGDIMRIIALFLKKEHYKKTKPLLYNNLFEIMTIDNDVEVVYQKYKSINSKRVQECKADPSREFLTEEEKLCLLKNIIDRDVFPNLNNLPPRDGESAAVYQNRINKSKIFLLAIMLSKIVEFAAGVRKLDDRDSWSNKRLETAGRLMDTLFRNAFKKQLSFGANKSGSTFSPAYTDVIPLESIASRVQSEIITDSFKDSMNTIYWGVKGSNKFKDNYTQSLQHETMFQCIAHINTIDVNIPRTDRNLDPRMIHQTSERFIDSIFTPEGGPCGILKNLSFSALMSIRRDDASILNLIANQIKDLPEDDNYDCLLVNTKPIGFCNRFRVYEYLVNLKRTGVIPWDTSIYIPEPGYLYVETSASRLMRPVLILDPVTQELEMNKHFKSTDKVTIDSLLAKGCIEFISPAEQEQHHCKFANSMDDVRFRLDKLNKASNDILMASRDLELAQERGEDTTEHKNTVRQFVEYYNEISKNKIYSHCEIDPTTLMGLVSACIPRPDTNQGPRNVYAGQMLKQNCSNPHIDHRDRHDFSTYKTIASPTKPLFYTSMYKYLGFENKGSGENPIHCFLSSSQTEEDAWKVCKQYLDCGGYRGTKYTTYTINIKKGTIEKLEKPFFNDPIKDERYKYIQDNGIICIGAPVKGDDILVSRTKKADGRIKYDGLKLKSTEKGVVDSIIVNNTIDSIDISIKVRWNRIPQKGDKFAPINAQKATIGTIVDCWKLPFFIYGYGPSWISNVLSLPTRMTMSYDYEELASKTAALECKPRNATAFNKDNIDYYRRILREHKKDEYGEEYIYSGLSGRMMDKKVFSGPVHIMALKHQVEDKFQAREYSGRNNDTTNQPVAGRKLKGGLKFGEMERDSITSHGAAYTIINFLMKTSDDYKSTFCQCGNYATYQRQTGNWRKCKMHEDVKPFGVFEFPYVFKYFTQILLPVNLWIRPIFVTLKEYGKGVLDGTLYNKPKGNEDEALTNELADFDQDMFEEIQDAQVSDLNDYEDEDLE